MAAMVDKKGTTVMPTIPQTRLATASPEVCGGVPATAPGGGVIERLRRVLRHDMYLAPDTLP